MTDRDMGSPWLFAEQLCRLVFESYERRLNLLALGFDLLLRGVRRHAYRRSDGQRNGCKRAWNLCAVPAAQAPKPRSLHVKRHNGISREFREPDYAGLDFSGWTSRAIDGKASRPPLLD